ncbi:hypothetical protein K501DRAFT_315725 [Backusella circina FSU 941]|nr:hypothetical protein K501DRAFT_315725 [Backusella circina FSU 941]
MKKPAPHHISKSFIFTCNDINKLKLPIVFKSFEISKWGDFDELVKIASNQKRPLNVEQSHQKGKTAFKTIENNYKRNANIAAYSGIMAGYLDNDTGKKEYSLVFHQKQMKTLDQKESQIKERVTKKMRIGLYEGIENQLNEEASSTEQPATEENEAESCQEYVPYYVPIKKRIFTDGSELHEKFKQGQKLEPKERDRMASGISGILDLTNEDNKCQVGLFSNHDWKRIKDKYSRSNATGRFF